jgi:aspartate/methionine/tyrosine aminotransferase
MKLDVAFPEQERIVFSVHTFSKSFSLTGYRLGYVTAPNDDRADLLTRVQEATLVSPSTPVQFAGLAALSEHEHLRLHHQYVRSTRDDVVQILNKASLLWTIPQGGWYAVLDVSSRSENADVFCRRLLEDAAVALAPGRAFTPPGHPLATRLARVALCRERTATLRGIQSLVEWSGN